MRQKQQANNATTTSQATFQSSPQRLKPVGRMTQLGKQNRTGTSSNEEDAGGRGEPVSAVVGRDDEGPELGAAVAPRAERRQDAAGDAVVAAVSRQLPLQRRAAAAPRPARRHPGGSPPCHWPPPLDKPTRGFTGREMARVVGAPPNLVARA